MQPVLVVEGGRVPDERRQCAGEDDGVAVGEVLLIGDGQGVLSFGVFGAVCGAAGGGDDGGGAGAVGEFSGEVDIDAADDGDSCGVAKGGGVFAVDGFFLAGGLDGVGESDAVFAL